MALSVRPRLRGRAWSEQRRGTLSGPRFVERRFLFGCRIPRGIAVSCIPEVGPPSAAVRQFSSRVVLERNWRGRSRISLSTVHFSGGRRCRPATKGFGPRPAAIIRLPSCRGDEREPEPTQVCRVIRSRSARTADSAVAFESDRFLTGRGPLPSRHEYARSPLQPRMHRRPDV